MLVPSLTHHDPLRRRPCGRKHFPHAVVLHGIPTCQRHSYLIEGPSQARGPMHGQPIWGSGRPSPHNATCPFAITRLASSVLSTKLVSPSKDSLGVFRLTAKSFQWNGRFHQCHVALSFTPQTHNDGHFQCETLYLFPAELSIVLRTNCCLSPSPGFLPVEKGHELPGGH